MKLHQAKAVKLLQAKAVKLHQAKAVKLLQEKIMTCICLTACGLMLTSCSGAKVPPLENVEYTSDSEFTCEYDGLKHDVILDFPKETKKAPLILMLHGYGNSAESFRTQTGFETVACPEGYLVAYVTGAPDSSSSTASTGWNSGLGLSENKDVEFLTAMVNYLEDTYKTDPRRTYAVGFSNGAFMTHRLAMEASDTFEAIVSVAGMMPESVWEARPDRLSMSVFQITGEKDDVVPKNLDGSAKYSPNPAIEDVMDYYIQMADAKPDGTEEVGSSELTTYTSPSGKVIRNLWVKDGRHSWPTPDLQKIDTNRLILDFLKDVEAAK